MKHTRPKQAILLVLLSAVIALGAIPAFAVSAEDFVDRFDPYQPENTAYWGWSYIDYAAKAGIIEGYAQPDGTRIFLPANDVTKQEAMTMIANTISRALPGASPIDLTGAASEKWNELLSSSHIDPWAFPYVSYGLECGILTEEELSLFMVPSETSEHALSFVSSPATREEVITWVGRALWARYAATEASIFSLAYTDADNVSAIAAPYLALLTRIGIISGIVEEDGTAHFDPKRTLTRVEFAVICNKVFERPKHAVPDFRFVAKDGIVSNCIVSESGIGSFRIDNETFYSYGGSVYRNGVPVETGLASLADGDMVLVSWGEDGVLHLDTAPVKRSGKIIAIRQEDSYGYRLLSILLSDGTEESVQYYLNPSAGGVTVNGRIATGQSVTFLTDGVTIIELANN